MPFRRVAILAGCVLLLVLPASPGQARRTGTLTIKVLSVVTTSKSSDIEPKGVSPGDRIKVTDRLYNLVPQFGKPKGALVGSDSAVLTILAGKQTAGFRGVAKLPGGTIVARGRVSVGGKQSTLTVVGGTAHFAGARGRVVVHDLGKGRATNVFRLTMP